MMHKHFIGLLIGLVTVLLTMIGYQEYLLSTGEIVILKTAPVDPRDIFRGEYVILNYEISQQAEAMINHDFIDAKQVYVSLDTTQSPAIVSRVSEQIPVVGLYIKGKIERRWNNDTDIIFPSLSQYYVPEGQGKVIEDLKPGSLKVKIAIKNGQARIIGLIY